MSCAKSVPKICLLEHFGQSSRLHFIITIKHLTIIQQKNLYTLQFQEVNTLHNQTQRQVQCYTLALALICSK